jgi:hypothetical protein
MKLYKFNIEKLKKTNIGVLANLYSELRVPEDADYFEEVKHLLIIPEEPKSLGEIQKDFEDKIDNIVLSVKNKYKMAKERAEKNYNRDLQVIRINFETAIKTGYFPQRISCVQYNSDNFLTTSSASLSWTRSVTDSIFSIGSSSNSVGYYEISNTCRIFIDKKPNFITKTIVKLIFNWSWKNVI